MKTLRSKESGIVSIFVTSMLIIVVSLIVLSFAQISRREQRESLDTQLSSQAYYAAETGVNDAKAAIKGYLAANPGADVPGKDKCNDNSLPYDFSQTKVLSATDNVSYSCVTINPTPKYLPVTSGTDAQIIPLKTTAGNTFNSLTIKWSPQKSGTSTDVSTCPTATTELPQAQSGWKCPYGGLRIDLVPFTGQQTHTSLVQNNMALFLMPSKNAANSGKINFNPAASGAIVPAATCDTGTCSVTIQNLSGTTYYMRLSQLYLTANVVITGNGGDIQFRDAQALVDSTGKAQDVLRRVVVGVPLIRADDKVSNSALNSGDSICKRFRVNNGYFSTDLNGAGTNSQTQPGGVNPLCAAGGSSVALGAADPNADFVVGLRADPGGVTPVPGPGPYWERHLTNTTAGATAATVARCTWNWGDNSPDSTDWCYTGDYAAHTFPSSADLSCRSYTVTLTVFFNNGTSARKVSPVSVPTGGNFPSC